MGPARQARGGRLKIAKSLQLGVVTDRMVHGLCADVIIRKFSCRDKEVRTKYFGKSINWVTTTTLS